jgi:hypothetical protein
MDEPIPLGGLPLGVLVLAYLATMPPDQARARRMVHPTPGSTLILKLARSAWDMFLLEQI